jgi:outer membrane protein TolC
MLNRKKLPHCLIGMIPLLLLFGGCAMVGPDYVKPPLAPEQKNWIEQADPKIKAEPTDLANWWLVFDDPVLNSLVEQAYQQNLPLRIAGLRILEARAQLGIASGLLYPQQQQGSGGIARNKISTNRLNLPPDTRILLMTVLIPTIWHLTPSGSSISGANFVVTWNLASGPCRPLLQAMTTPWSHSQPRWRARMWPFAPFRNGWKLHART